MNAAEKLAVARLRVVRGFAPYLAQLLTALVPIESPGLGAIGVSESLVLVYDPFWVETLDVDLIAGLLVHEALHVIFRHGARRAERDPPCWNLAADLAINPAVREMRLPLPIGGVLPEKLGLPRGLTADEYYDILEQRNEGGDDGKPSTGSGHCGSCAGYASEGEDSADVEGAAEHGSGRSSGEVARVVRATLEAVADAARVPGKVPSLLAREAASGLAPARIDWRQRLRALTRHAVAWRPGASDHRYDAPSRRQAGIGYGPGKPVLPRLRQPLPRVAVIVDTSGSMGARELGAALADVGGVLRAVGADVDFCAADAAVGALRSVASVAVAAKLLVGGGGTDFGPALAALAKRRPRPEVVVYVTDGCGPAPTTPPPFRVVWCLVGGSRAPAAWGDAVVVDDLPPASAFFLPSSQRLVRY